MPTLSDGGYCPSPSTVFIGAADLLVMGPTGPLSPCHVAPGSDPTAGCRRFPDNRRQRSALLRGQRRLVDKKRARGHRLDLRGSLLDDLDFHGSALLEMNSVRYG